MSAESSLLRVDDLSVSIGDTSILSSLSFGLDAGSTLGIVGESGSGKSMTALAIMQLLPRGATAHGSIRFDDRELLALDERELQQLRGADISMVFQEPMSALNPVHSVGVQVAESLRLHQGLARASAMEQARTALDRVGLESIGLDRYPHELSGGQRQRVVIAIAIACKPRLLIADEPTTALDVTTQAEILDLLADLQRDTGMAMILISHDLAVVANTADSLIVMRDGAIVDAGDAEQLLSRAASDNDAVGYTRELLQASSWRPSLTASQARHAEPLLEVKGVSASYPVGPRRVFGVRDRQTVVDEVSFVIHAGENVGLVGESGSGKSTLARCLLGLMPIDTGEVLLRGQRLHTPVGSDTARTQPMARAARRAVQIVFQDPYGSFNPRHRVERLVSEPLHLLDERPGRRERRRRVEALLERVGLNPADTLKRYIHEFSGGQRQRIAIARALIVQPSLVILDEAVSALDVSVRAQVLALLAELAVDEGLAYVFVSHDLSVVRNVTDRVMIMYQGRIVESGETRKVFDAPTSSYAQQLVKAIPTLPDPAERRSHY